MKKMKFIFVTSKSFLLHVHLSGNNLKEFKDGMKNKVFFVMILLGTIVFNTDSLIHGKEIRGVTDDTITIGIIMDQTSVGAPMGVPLTQGARTYFRHINDQGGINSRKVKVIVEDDRYTIPGAFAAFKKLIFKDEVLSILYCGGTGQTMALMNDIEKYKVPIITISLSEKLTTPVRRYIFTPAASYDDGFKIIVDYIMRDLGAKNPKIAFVYPDVEFGKTGLRVTEEYLPHYNLKLATSVVISLGAIDVTSQILILKREQPDYVILHNALAGVISFFKAAKQYKFRSKVIGSFYVSSEEDNITATGDAMKDALAVGVFGYWSDDTPGMAQVRKITKKYYPDVKKMPRNYIQGWVTSMICAEGLIRAGRKLTPDTFVDALETFKNFSTGELSGHITYSKGNHKGGTTNRIYRVDAERQTFVTITGYREPFFKD